MIDAAEPRPAPPSEFVLHGLGLRIAPDGWTNGFVAEIGPVPEAFKRLKGYQELPYPTPLQARFKGLYLYRLATFVGYQPGDPATHACFLVGLPAKKIVLNSHFYVYFNRRHPGIRWFARSPGHVVLGSMGLVKEWIVAIMPIAGLRVSTVMPDGSLREGVE